MTIAYLDWNATPPPLDAALEALAEVARSNWGNPSSIHRVGRQARKVLEDARDAVGSLVGRAPRDVIFTSGGTEANNLGIRALCREADLLVTSRLEHPSVVRLAEHLQDQGFRVHWLAVGAQGRVDAAEVAQIVGESKTPSRVVVALQAANHETGVVQPLHETLDIVQRAGAMIHVDAVQAAGKIPAELWKHADTVAIASHKIRGPKGIGALATRGCGPRLSPMLLGGAQEGGMRPGTLSVSLAAGFGCAADWARSGPARYAPVCQLRDALEARLVELGAQINGGTSLRMPHVTNVSFPGIAGDELVMALDVLGVCVSSGSACSAGSAEHSPVIEAMLGAVRARTALRASLGETTTVEEISLAISAVEKIVWRARRMDEVLLEVGSEALG